VWGMRSGSHYLKHFVSFWGPDLCMHFLWLLLRLRALAY
jgi:hypothetical protein